MVHDNDEERGAGAAALVALMAGAAQAEAKTVVVRAAHHVCSSKRVDGAQVVITDGRITAVGKAGDAVPAVLK
jgi:imidazolonepropionase-like amidohydrolase